MRDAGRLHYMLTNHPGSVVAVTSSTGARESEQRYLPFSGVRLDVGTIAQTDYGYTGQRLLDSGMGGIMDYKARLHVAGADAACLLVKKVSGSSYINHFLQPDTIIPDWTNPQALNRYSYVANRPLSFNDPTGNKPCDGTGIDGECDQAKADDLLGHFGITANGLRERKKWELADAASVADQKFRAAGYGTFRYMHQGEITVIGVGVSRSDCETEGFTITCGSSAQYVTAFLHEFGHVLDNRFNLRASDLDPYYDSEGGAVDGGDYWTRSWEGFFCWDSITCSEHPSEFGYGGACNNPQSEQCIKTQKMEHWADLFMNWVLDGSGDPYHGFTGTSSGDARRLNMEQQFYWLLTGGRCQYPVGTTCSQ